MSEEPEIDLLALPSRTQSEVLCGRAMLVLVGEVPAPLKEPEESPLVEPIAEPPIEELSNPQQELPQDV